MSADRPIPLSMSTPVQDANRPLNGDSFGKEADFSTPPLSGGQLWRHRLAVLLFVFFCAILGVILIIFPWRDEWTNNSLLFGHLGLQNLLSSGFVRGLFSGLGLIDVWIGFWEAIHYHE